MNSVKLPYREVSAILLTFTVVQAILNLPIQPANAQKTYYVNIADFAFNPQKIYIEKGDTIVWTNNDPVIYTLWFVYKENQSTYLLSDPIPPEESWSWFFNESVELQYYSFERLWITGYITVTPPVPVGGIVTPVDKLGLLAPYIGLASTIAVATVATTIYVKRVKRRKRARN